MDFHKKGLTNLTAAKDGSYARNSAKHRSVVCSGEPGRYHLYVSLACPWAAGALSMLYLKGLEGAVSISIVHPTWARTKPDDPEDTHCGWTFRAPGDAPLANPKGHGSNECDDALVPDTVNSCEHLRNVYELCGDTQGPFTTPMLWDKKERTIVSNESIDILRILHDSFESVCANKGVDLYPAAHQEALLKLNEELIYPCVNNGVYRCGFARSQAAYDKAVGELFDALETLDERLGKSAYLFGDTFTWLDLRLFHTLVRFDPVYVVYFKTNRKRIEDFPNLLKFVRRVYAFDAVSRSTNLKHIKMHYFTSHPHLNPFGIIPVSNGPTLGPSLRL